VAYLGDADTAPSSTTVVVEVEKATPTVSGSVDPDTVAVGDTATVDIDVSATGFTPTGDVDVLVNGMVVTRVTLSNGSATAQIGPFDSAGSYAVTLNYLGDENAEAASGSAGTVDVEKVTPRMRVDRTPKKVVEDRTRVKLFVSVRAQGEPATGEVRVKGEGYNEVHSLRNGEATFALGKFKKPGRKTFTIVYLGSDSLARVTEEIEFKVKRKRRR